MKIRPAYRAIALAALPWALASGCTSTGANAPEDTTVLVGVPAPVLQATAGSVGLAYHRNALTRELLVTMSTDGRPTPKVIESWRGSDDQLTWQLTVRDGVRFHDGVVLDAQVLAAHVGAQLAALSQGEVRDVSAIDDRTLRIRLNRPYAFLFEDLSVISAQRSEGGRTIDTGPYRVTEESASHLELAAFDNYYRGKPEIETVEVKLFPDQRNAWSALMRGEIDLLYEVSPEALQFVRGESSIAVTTFPRQYVYLLGFNQRHPSLGDARVRQALDIAVNREALVETSLSGEGEPAQGHVWPRHWSYDAAAGRIEYNPARAVRVLQGAGYGVLNAPDRMPARLRLRCLVYEPLQDMALLLQRQLAEIDIDLELEILPTGQLIERLMSGDFETFLFEMTATRGLKFTYQFWHSSTPLLNHGYAGADDVLDRIRHAANDAEYRAAASEFQRRLHEDPPAIFLAWGRTSRAVSKRFEIPAGDDDIYHTIARWKPAANAGN